jgi:hypothetical protein
MAELSHVAKAVDDATAEVEARIEFTDLAAGFNAYRNAVAVAALRAVAEWAIPDNSGGSACCIDTCEAIHADILAIATELENHQ